MSNTIVTQTDQMARRRARMVKAQKNAMRRQESTISAKTLTVNFVDGEVSQKVYTGVVQTDRSVSVSNYASSNDASKDAALGTKDAALATKDAALAAKDVALATKDAIIARLEAEIVRANNAITEAVNWHHKFLTKEQEHKDLNVAFTKLQIELNTKSKDADDKSKDADDKSKEAELAHLRQQCGALQQKCGELADCLEFQGNENAKLEEYFDECEDEDESGDEFSTTHIL